MAAPSSTSSLFGSCACERNQYTILIPSSSTAQAQVFFDNSAANRRSQATPLTAWLRIPLSWYHSQTFALFPDESHASIRRTFHTPSSSISRTDGGGGGGGGGQGGVKRRQFCGYCGTHLNAWDEGQSSHGEESGERGEGWMDVTLGSLLDDSLRELEELGVLADSEDEVEDTLPLDSSNPSSGDVTMSNNADSSGTTTTTLLQPHHAAQRMRNRGMPYFESMVENSRLGRIKRQKGGHTSRDGRTTVEWEVVEIGGGEGEAETAAPEEREGGGDRSKRPRLEP